MIARIARRVTSSILTASGNIPGISSAPAAPTLYYAEWENGQRVVEPEKARGTDYILPGYTETSDLKPLSGEGKTSPPPFANVNFLGKPKNPHQIGSRQAGRLHPAHPGRPGRQLLEKHQRPEEVREILVAAG